MKVLIVDDEPAVQRLEKRMLDAAGFNCLAVSTAREACELLASEPVDVAVLDVGLGDDSGLTLARHIKKEFPRTVVIMVTGAADFTSVSDARLAGIQISHRGCATFRHLHRQCARSRPSRDHPPCDTRMCLRTVCSHRFHRTGRS